MDKKRLGLWAPILVLTAALVVLAVSTDAVEAGGRGKGGGKPAPAATVTMAVSPNPPIASQAFIVSGTGFTPGAPVNFVMGGYASYTSADQNGYADEIWTVALPGTATITTKQLTSRGWVQAGSITFEVVR